MLQPEQICRLRSHLARLNGRLPAILADAGSRLAGGVPQARGALTMSTPARAHEIACLAAHVAKHLGVLATLRPWLADLGRRWHRHGFDVDAGRALAERALVDAVRAHAGANWSLELERDWRELARELVEAMSEGGSVELAQDGERVVRLAA